MWFKIPFSRKITKLLSGQRKEPFHLEQHRHTKFPWWLSDKEPACQCRRRRFNPWVVRSPRGWQPTPVFSPEKSHGQRGLAGCSPLGRKRGRRDLPIKQQPSMLTSSDLTGEHKVHTLCACCVYALARFTKQKIRQAVYLGTIFLRSWAKVLEIRKKHTNLLSQKSLRT